VGIALLLAGLGLAFPQLAPAQLPADRVGRNPITRPTVSPYLNYFNRGNGAGLNYYNFVRPQQQMRQTADMLSREIGSLQSSVNGLGQMPQRDEPMPPLTTGRMMPTGHSTTFGSTGSFFPTSAQGAPRSGQGPRSPTR